MKARKEITIAVFIGLLVGLLVVGGIIRARSALSSLDTSGINLPLKKGGTSTDESGAPTELFLTLETPDNLVSSSPNVTLRGSTLPDTYVVILAESKEYIITPNDVGTFAQDLTLIPGANQITITVYQEDGTNLEKTLTAVYTTAEI